RKFGDDFLGSVLPNSNWCSSVPGGVYLLCLQRLLQHRVHTSAAELRGLSAQRLLVVRDYCGKLRLHRDYVRLELQHHRSMPESVRSAPGRLVLQWEPGMKTLIPFVLSLLAAVASQNCQAASAWLIVARSGHHELMYGNGSGLRSVLQLGDRTVYGTSNKKIGVVSPVSLSNCTKLFIVNMCIRMLDST